MPGVIFEDEQQFDRMAKAVRGFERLDKLYRNQDDMRGADEAEKLVRVTGAVDVDGFYPAVFIFRNYVLTGPGSTTYVKWYDGLACFAESLDPDTPLVSGKRYKGTIYGLKNGTDKAVVLVGGAGGGSGGGFAVRVTGSTTGDLYALQGNGLYALTTTPATVVKPVHPNGEPIAVGERYGCEAPVGPPAGSPVGTLPVVQLHAQPSYTTAVPTGFTCQNGDMVPSGYQNIRVLKPQP